jgi:hypothetical protein
MTKVLTFELIGPPCEVPGCNGTLVDTIDWKTKECFRKCSKCSTKFGRMPLADKWVGLSDPFDECLGVREGPNGRQLTALSETTADI